MSYTITPKSFTVRLDTNPAAGPGITPVWTEVEFISMSGDLSIRSMPYMEATITVQIPAGVAAARFDARNYTRVRINATHGAANRWFPDCYIVQARPIDRDGRVYELHVVSEDARLLEPTNPTAEIQHYRAHATMDTLVPAVCSDVVTVEGGMPVAGVRCDPLYEKRNLLLNPSRLAGGEQWHKIGYDAGPMAGGGPVTVVSSSGPGGVLGAMFSPHQFERRISVTEGHQYTFAVQITVGSSNSALGRSFEVGCYFPAVSDDLGAPTSYDVARTKTFYLSDGTKWYSSTVTVPPGCTEVWLRAGIIGPSLVTDSFIARHAIFTEADPGDPEGEFWSGDTADTADYEYDWTGLAGQSYSIRYPVTPRSLESALLEPGESLWSVLEPHMSREGWRLLPHSQGKWRVVATAALPYGGVPFFAYDTLFAEDSKHISQEQGTDRSAAEFADAIVLHYSWRSGRRGQQEAYDTAAIPSPTKVKVVELTQPYPGSGAATKYLEVARRGGQPITVEAPLVLSHPPGYGLTTDDWYGLIEQMSFDTETDLCTFTMQPKTAN